MVTSFCDAWNIVKGNIQALEHPGFKVKLIIIGSVDSISRGGPDTPMIIGNKP